MGIFRCNENIKSYTYPISKIILCAILIVLLISRNYIISVNSSLVNVIIAIVCFGGVIAAILCVYLSVAEMILLHERREKANFDLEAAIEYSKEYSIDDVLSLLITNDITEIIIILNNQIVKVGASSDCYPGSSQFFDKVYYMNDTAFSTIDELKKELVNHYPERKVCVIAIDDIPPK